jgi:hypothetical protein
VVLLPKPAEDPLLSSSYRSIGILPALSKVWEHTCKILMERCLERDPVYKEQYGFRRRRNMSEERAGVRFGRSGR